MDETPHRAEWTGAPERLPDAFRLTKRKRGRTLAAVCETWSHALGWEVRLTIDEHTWQARSVIASSGDMRNTVEHWRAALIRKGWAVGPDRPSTTDPVLPGRPHL
jgi:hypothetical protein